MNIQQKVKNCILEKKKAERKYKLGSRLVVNFPKLEKVPILSKLAMKIIHKQGGILDTQYYEDKKR